MEEIDPALIAQWKSEYGQIFSVDQYVFRALTIGEHAALLLHKEWSGADAEDYIVSTTLLYPKVESFDSLPAGVISGLSDEVLNISGYGEVGYALKTMEAARERANEVINLMKIFVIAAMPSYTDDDLDKFTFNALAQKVGLAEKILEVRKGNSTLELVDPEAEQEKQEQKVRREKTTKKPGQAPSNDPIAQRLHTALGDV